MITVSLKDRGTGTPILGMCTVGAPSRGTKPHSSNQWHRTNAALHNVPFLIHSLKF
jgi:hypothetical protein